MAAVKKELPQVVEPISVEKVKAWCLTTGNLSNAVRLLCLERCDDNARTLAQTMLSLSATKSPPDQIALMIGPEGGFTSSEIINIQQSGFAPVSLGPLILRSETAAIAAMTILMALSVVIPSEKNFR